MPLLAIPAGCQILRTKHWFWHPAGVRLLTMPEPGVSLRSTPQLPSGIPPECFSPAFMPASKINSQPCGQARYFVLSA